MSPTSQADQSEGVDVVAVKIDVIFNFQCKNNWIDLGSLEF